MIEVAPGIFEMHGDLTLIEMNPGIFEVHAAKGRVGIVVETEGPRPFRAIGFAGETVPGRTIFEVALDLMEPK